MEIERSAEAKDKRLNRMVAALAETFRLLAAGRGAGFAKWGFHPDVSGNFPG